MRTTLLALIVGLAALAPAHAQQGLGDGICETTTTTGNGTTINLAGAYTATVDYLPFDSQIANGTPVEYTIESSDGKFEHGRAVFNTGTPDTLTSRTADASSDGLSTNLTLPAGTHIVCLQSGSRTFQGGEVPYNVRSLDFDGTTDTTLDREAAGRLGIEGIAVNRRFEQDATPTCAYAGDTWRVGPTKYDCVYDGNSWQWVDFGGAVSATNREPGEVFYVSTGDTCPGYAIKAGTQNLSKTAYPRWWAAVEAGGNYVTAPTVAGPGQYRDNGDGTFDAPGFDNNEFIRHADGTTRAGGSAQADGAPDIDGTFTAFYTVIGGTSGAFTVGPSIGSFRDTGIDSANSAVFAASDDDPNTYSDANTEVVPHNIAYPACFVY